MQASPVLQGETHCLSFWRIRTTLNILNGGLIHRNKAGSRACLNRHIADGHTPFHR